MTDYTHCLVFSSMSWWECVAEGIQEAKERQRRSSFLEGPSSMTWSLSLRPLKEAFTCWVTSRQHDTGGKSFSTDICLNRHKHSNIFPNGFPLSGLLLGSSSCFSLSIFNFLRLSPSLQPRLTWNSQWSSCLILHSAGIRGVNPHSKINFPSSESFLHITGVFLLWFLHVVSLYIGSGIIYHCVTPTVQSETLVWVISFYREVPVILIVANLMPDVNLF